MPATVEELTGLIAGLSEVVKGLTTNLSTVATQVSAFATASTAHLEGIEGDPATTAVSNPNLRLPTL